MIVPNVSVVPTERPCVFESYVPTVPDVTIVPNSLMVSIITSHLLRMV